MKLHGLFLATLMISACNQAQPRQEENFSTMVPKEAYPPAPSPPSPQAPAPAPVMKPLIDPKSPEGAGQVVQHYGALIEQGRWTDSWKLWSSKDAARQFDRNWRDDSEVHLEIGHPGDLDGAAGSIYVTVPVTFYGESKAGASFRRPASVVLRRVNDVPGSTEAQRRWHIERVDWGS